MGSGETFYLFDSKNSFLMESQSYNAKLSDFGLAKDGPTGDKSHVSTRVMGTYGYAAPEYLATGIVHFASLMFSTNSISFNILWEIDCF